MSRILRRPMFRGGKVDSRGTGITTGLDQPRIGAKGGRFFGDTGNVFTSGLALQPVSSFTPRVSARGRTINPPLPTNQFAGLETMTDAMPGGTYNVEQEDELINVGDVELGLPKSKIEDLTTTEEVETPKKDDDEPEVTMTDLEKALGLDRARQEYAADALAAASAAFFEGKGFGAIADAAKVKSKAPDIKRLAALEEFKAKKAAELFKLKDKKKQFAPGNVQKTVDYLVGQGMDKDEAIKRATKQSGTFAEELSKNSVGGTILPQGFALAAETFYGSDYKGDVTAVEVINADRSTKLPDGFYSDKDNKLIFEVKDKKVVFDRSYS